MDKTAEFFKLIEENQSIVIFGHIYPDGDCYGASEGLMFALEEFYPDKEIYVSQTDWHSAPDSFPHASFVKDEIIKRSLHIIVDLPDRRRIGDKRAFDLPGTGMIKVDHHYFADDFGGLEIIDENRASVSDFLASMLYSRFKHLPKMAASLFYLGLTTDSGRFQYYYDSNLLSIAARLSEDGADVQTIYDSIYVVSEDSVQFKGYLFSNYQKTFFGVSYCKVPYEVSKKYGYDGHGAALCVNTIGNIEESHVYVIFGEDQSGKVYCELRSKGPEIDVHKIAVEFGGGGHFNASGCTLASMSEADKVIQRLEDAVIKSYGEYHQELKTLLSLAESCSSIIMGYYRLGFQVEIKDDNSPVTTADKASDQLIRDTLLKEYPSYGLLTEEDKDDKSRLNKDLVFIIDPLDGTSDFVEKDNEFAVNLALTYKGVPVLGVVAIPYCGDIYFAVKGKGSFLKKKDKMIQKIHVSYKTKDLKVLRSVFHFNEKLQNLYKNKGDLITSIVPCGSALKACKIAAGQAEVCYAVGNGTKEWDTCAPQLIVEEAGGIYTDNLNEVMKYNRDDVYNHHGFTILNREENNILSSADLEKIK